MITEELKEIQERHMKLRRPVDKDSHTQMEMSVKESNGSLGKAGIIKD